VSLTVATNLLAALTGSASGGLTIALDALGSTYMRLAAEHGIDPALLHRIAVLSAGTLDSLPQNGAVVTLLAVCGSTHRESYLDIVMAAIVGPILLLAAVIALVWVFGVFYVTGGNRGSVLRSERGAGLFGGLIFDQVRRYPDIEPSKRTPRPDANNSKRAEPRLAAHR